MMKNIGPRDFNNPAARFAFDNIRDGFKDDSLVIWEAYDTVADKSGWILGRKIILEGEARILPCALLLGSQEAITRYAPALGSGGWDFTQVAQGKRIIVPPN